MTESRSPQSRMPAALHDLRATIAERRASGRDARKRAQRGTLGYRGEEDRGHDALDTILAQNQLRVPELVPLRHHRVAIDAYIGKGPKFTAAIGRFARLYADQNQRDYAQLASAVATGAVESLPG